MSEHVRITEVGPRDGLQNEPGIIPTEEKVRLVELCAESGMDEVEVTSFVSPKWVPQLGDASDLLARLKSFKNPSHEFSALVPNEKGMLGVIEAGSGKFGPMVDKVSVFTAASETFSRKNTNASIAESIERFEPVVALAYDHGLRVRGYVSCVIACPFEGPISPDQVMSVCEQLADLGVDEIDLGDTIGAGTPENVSRLLEMVRVRMGDIWWQADSMTLHLHDTFGRAADCVKAALQHGVRSFDGSVAGLGGCPYASTPGKRAPGNISTETLVKTIHAEGFSTGVDLDRLANAAEYARTIVANARARAATPS